MDEDERLDVGDVVDDAVAAVTAKGVTPDALRAFLDGFLAKAKAAGLPDAAETWIREKVPGTVADNAVVRIAEGLVGVAIDGIGELAEGYIEEYLATTV